MSRPIFRSENLTYSIFLNSTRLSLQRENEEEVRGRTACARLLFASESSASARNRSPHSNEVIEDGFTIDDRCCTLCEASTPTDFIRCISLYLLCCPWNLNCWFSIYMPSDTAIYVSPHVLECSKTSGGLCSRLYLSLKRKKKGLTRAIGGVNRPGPAAFSL